MWCFHPGEIHHIGFTQWGDEEISVSRVEVILQAAYLLLK